MKVDLDKYLVVDLKKIILEDAEQRIFKTYDGYAMAFDDLSKDDRRYIIRLMCECYESGARRCVNEINRDADRQVAEAQNRAIKKILKGKY